VLAAGIGQGLAVAGLARLPSPLFGGDLYYQMGCVRSIRASLDPMASCSTSGALPGYLPLYGTLIAALSLITRLEPFHAMMVGAVLFRMLAVGLVAWIVGRLFDRTVGLLAGALWYLAHPGLIARYTDLGAQIVAPLFFFALCRFLLDRNARAALVLGLAIATAGYTHAVLFIGTVIVTGVALAGDALAARGERSWPAHLGAAARRALLVAAPALLALGYWWKPIVHYHGRTSLHYADWNGGPSLATWADRLDYSRAVIVGWLSPAAPLELLLTLLAAAGGWIAWRRRREPVHRVVGVVGLVTLLHVFHFLLTQPLLGVHFVPQYVIVTLWSFARLLLAAMAIAALVERVRARASRSAVDRALAWGAVALAVVAGVLAAASASLEPGRAPLHPMYLSLQQHVEAHTRHDDVFLSTNELSFALSALTGRKVVVTRRAQNDAFIDMDVRNKDAALILYGGDPALRRRLLDRYRVRYLLWTDEWPSTEYYFDASGQVRDYDDPLLYFENAAYDRELTEAGVRWRHLVGWVDPMLRGERHPRFPLTLVTPDNYTRPDRPWQPDLDALLEPVWTYREGDRVIAALYRIRSAGD
jgi:hypothetical protein